MNEVNLFALTQQVLWAFFVFSFAVGFISQRTHFCTMGAIADVINIGDWTRARQWMLAIGVAMIGFAVLAGLVLRTMRHTAAALKAGENRLRFLALHDPLSNLPNRNYFGDRLESAIASVNRGGPSSAVFYIDLDHFKSINDNFGHAAGDATLRRFAECISPILRPSDVMARFGGEEFLLLGLDTDLRGAAAVAERIRSATESMRVPGLPPGRKITTSIGVTAFVPGESTSQALQRADMALYAAKLGGPNRVEVSTAGNPSPVQVNSCPAEAQRP